MASDSPNNISDESDAETSTEAPVTYASREEYEAAMEAVAKDESLSPSTRADILANTPEPEETYEEYLERHDD